MKTYFKSCNRFCTLINNNSERKLNSLHAIQIPALSPSIKTQLLWSHGVFDSSKNFINVAQKECLKKVAHSHLIDARNHGLSFHAKEMSFKLMAKDLVEYIANGDLKEIFLLGHSMSGRAMMTALSQHKSFLQDRVKGVIIVDIMPSSYTDLKTGPTDQMYRFFQEMKSIDLNNKTYEQVVQEVRSKFEQEGIIQTILNNITIQNQVPQWCLNFSALENSFQSMLDFSVPFGNWKGQRKVIIGGKSKFTSAERVKKDYPNIFEDFQMERDLLVFEDSAHFVYAKEPERFAQEVANFITKVNSEDEPTSRKKYLEEALSFDI